MIWDLQLPNCNDLGICNYLTVTFHFVTKYRAMVVSFLQKVLSSQELLLTCTGWVNKIAFLNFLLWRKKRKMNGGSSSKSIDG